MAKQKVVVEKKKRPKTVRPPIMSMSDLAKLGDGTLAYIRELNTDEAQAMFPALDLPTGVDLFALHAADGTPIVLTDSRKAAIGHAMGDDLEVAAVH